MVTEEQTTVAEVVEIAPYDGANPQYGDFVRVRYQGEQGTRRYTLGKTLDRAKAGLAVGAKLRLVFESYMQPTGARDGSGRVFYNEKRRVIGAHAA